jgi:hypothetical protein
MMNSSSQGLNSSISGGNKATEISVSFDRTNSHKIPFPPVGFCRLSRNDQMSKAEISSLSKFNFSFYTILLNLYSNSWQDEFRKANSEAKGLKIPMLVILQFGLNIDKEIKDFIELCNSIFPFVEEVIILQKDNKVTPPGLLHKVLPVLREGLHHVNIGIGGYIDLEEILKQKPDLSEADFLSLPFQTGINPDKNSPHQIDSKHQVDLIHSYKTAAHAKDIYVIPMSLNAGLSFLAEDTSQLLEADSRLLHYLAASGRAISDFKTLIFSGANSISFYENGGKAEVFTADHSNINLEKINSIPFFYLLREVLEMNNGFIIQPINKSPELIDAFIFIAGSKIKVMLINLSAEAQAVSLAGISSHAKIIMHDSQFMKEILLQKEEFEENMRQDLSFRHGQAHIELQPYGIALIHE